MGMVREFEARFAQLELEKYSSKDYKPNASPVNFCFGLHWIEDSPLIIFTFWKEK